MKIQLAGEVIRASQGQQHQDSRDQKEWNLFIICIESNWFQFISFFHQPLQSQNFIQYPFTNQYLDALWGTPFANWFGAWNQQFFNKGFKKKKIKMFWDFERNHGDPNEKESIIKKSFWIISLLSAAFEDHQTPSGWQGSKNGIFLFIILDQIGFNSFPFYINHSNPKTLFSTPLLISIWMLCGVPPLPIDLGLEINSFLIRDLKRKKSKCFGILREIMVIQMKGNQSSRKAFESFQFRISLGTKRI